MNRKLWIIIMYICLFIFVEKTGGLLIQSSLCGRVVSCYKCSFIDLSLKGLAFEDTGCEIGVREQGAFYDF